MPVELKSAFSLDEGEVETPAVGRSRVSVQQRLVRGVQFFLHPLVYRIGESAGEIGEGGQRIGGPAGRGQGVHNGDGK